jgi:hypothetical protein
MRIAGVSKVPRKRHTSARIDPQLVFDVGCLRYPIILDEVKTNKMVGYLGYPAETLPSTPHVNCKGI